MDLFAYGQISDLERIAAENGIVIPRLRGYHLMRDEEPVSEEEIQRMMHEQTIQEAEWLIRADWTLFSCHEYSKRMDKKLERYLVCRMVDSLFEDGEKIIKAVGIRWDRIHGKKRKLLKWNIRKAEKRIRVQLDAWNKYAGQEDVLYIHSRMGGGNWHYYDDKKSITDQPWFLDRVDDYLDGTYCDFYAKIDVPDNNVGNKDGGAGDVR